MTLRTAKTIIAAILNENAEQFHDYTPTASDNFVLASNVALEPLQADNQQRGNMLPTLGHEGVVPINKRAQLSFDVELTPHGSDADTPPPWSDLLLACGFARTVTQNTNVVLKTTSDTIPASGNNLSIYVYMDGVRQNINGAVGTFTMALSPSGIPMFSFVYTGNHLPYADTAYPADGNAAKWQKPVGVDSKGLLTIDGVGDFKVSDLSIDLANNVVFEELLSSAIPNLLIVDRAPTLALTMDLPTAAKKDFMSVIAAGTAMPLVFSLGDNGAGKKVQISMPRVFFHSPQIGDRNGIRTLSMTGNIAPGLDAAANPSEIIITTT